MKVTKGMKRRDALVELLKNHGWEVSSRSSEVFTHVNKSYRLQVSSTAIKKEVKASFGWISVNGGRVLYIKDAVIEDRGIVFNDKCLVAW